MIDTQTRYLIIQKYPKTGA